MLKLAFYGVTPLKNKTHKEHKSTKGYSKELFNMAAGGTIGAASGGVIGTLGGAIAGSPGGPAGIVGGAAIGALAGSAIGGTSGAYKSLKKTEEKAKTKTTSKGKYFGRMTAALGLGAAGALTGFTAAGMTGNNPLTGAAIGGALGAYVGDRAVRETDSTPTKKKYLYQYR